MEKLSQLSVRYLKGIGPKRAQSFEKCGICSVEDLLYYFPKRYEDRTNFTKISDLKREQFQTIQAKVLASGERRSFRRRGFSVTEAIVEDETASVACVWFNKPYLKQYLKPGTDVILYGKLDTYSGKLQLSNPDFEISSRENDESLNIGRIVPVYSAPEGIGQRSFRKLIKLAIDSYLARINDFLPYDVRARNGLLNLVKIIINIHFPESLLIQKQAYTRLAFEEFFLFQLPLALRKSKKKEKPGIAHDVEAKLLQDFLKSLDFSLTESQKKVLECIDKGKFDSITSLADKIDLSTAMLYRAIDELKDMDLITTEEGLRLTDAGKIARL